MPSPSSLLLAALLRASGPPDSGAGGEPRGEPLPLRVDWTAGPSCPDAEALRVELVRLLHRELRFDPNARARVLVWRPSWSPPGLGCYPETAWWVCAPDGSGATGAYGDPCDLVNGCDPGLVCLSAAVQPPGLPCEGASGCCTELCDLGDPLGDAQCTGEAEGQTCEGWYAKPVAGFEDVGVCLL